VASQLRAVFYDARALRDRLGLPLLGVVTYVMGEGTVQHNSRELKKYWAGWFSLLLVFLAGMIVLSLKTGTAGY